MFGDAPFSNISFRNQSDDVKGIIERTTIKSRRGVGRQNLSGQNIYFQYGTGQRLFPYTYPGRTFSMDFDGFHGEFSVWSIETSFSSMDDFQFFHSRPENNLSRYCPWSISMNSMECVHGLWIWSMLSMDSIHGQDVLFCPRSPWKIVRVEYWNTFPRKVSMFSIAGQLSIYE